MNTLTINALTEVANTPSSSNGSHKENSFLRKLPKLIESLEIQEDGIYMDGWRLNLASVMLGDMERVANGTLSQEEYVRLRSNGVLTCSQFKYGSFRLPISAPRYSRQVLEHWIKNNPKVILENYFDSIESMFISSSEEEEVEIYNDLRRTEEDLIKRETKIAELISAIPEIKMENGVLKVPFSVFGDFNSLGMKFSVQDTRYPEQCFIISLLE